MPAASGACAGTTRLRQTLRLLLILSACALSVVFFFRYQIGNGFTLLLGDRHDAVIEISILEHWYNVLRGIESWSDTSYFFPVRDVLGYNDGYLLFGLIHAGFRSAGLDPFLASELVNLTTRVIGFLAMYGACRRILRLGFGWALLAAVLFTVSNNLFIRGSHAQLFSVSFVPVLALLLYAALAALLEGRRAALLGWGGGCALFFAACLMTGFYMAWYSVYLGGAVLLAWLVVAGGRQRRVLFSALRAQLLPLAGLLALAVVLNLPFLFLYLPKAAETGMHPWSMAAQHSPELLDLVHVGKQNLLFGRLFDLLNQTLRPGFPDWSERMTGLPPVLLLLFGASLAWLWRGAARMDPARLALLRAIGLGTLVTWALTLQLGGHSAWWLVYSLVPGAKAARVVARYQLFVTIPVIALAMVWLAAHARRLPGAILGLLCTLLLLEQVNLYAPLFLDRPLELARLNAVPPPPASCRAFYVSAARTESRFGEAVDDPYNHNTEAMLVAAVRHLPTVNGISTFNPPHWPGSYPGQPDYLPGIRTWAEMHGVTGLCALDLQRMEWDPAPRL
ncbi:MAG: hypothetical protein IRY87_10525 [Acetobacteraceae bacterium]|nr:hypothetical protein [Acetobacteraceae bacterium]